MFGLQTLLVAPVLALSAAVPLGPYTFSHQAGQTDLAGGLRLGRHGASHIGITTDMLQCQRPGQTPFYPGPPFNWQPQQTVPVRHVKGGLKLSFNGSFRDRISGFPERMTLHARITSKGIAGEVCLYADDNVASTGEEICHTRGLIPFKGKRPGSR